MADKSNTGLPPPPESQPALFNRLLTILSQMGIGLKQPVAQSRITRTPIYQGGVQPGAGGYYDPSSKAISAKEGNLQDLDFPIIPHESSHAIFDKANLAPFASQLIGKVPYSAGQEVLENPAMYPNPNTETMANEGLGYSIGKTWGTPYVEHVASKIKDPALAQQLLRLHRNALGARNPTNPL